MWFRRRRESKSGEATKALEDAKKNLREVKERGTEVTEVAEALKEIRQRNHFAEALEDLLTRRKPLHDT